MSDPRAIDAEYAPGAWVAVTGARFWMLIETEPTNPLVQTCWELMKGQPSLGSILSELLRGGLQSVGNFALTGDGRAIVRGDARVVLTMVDGERVDITASDVTTWIERPVGDDVVQLDLLSSAEPASVRLPLAGGVTMAASVRVRHADRAAVAEPASEVITEPTPADAASVVADVVAPVPSPDLPAPVEELPDAPRFDHLFGATQRPLSPAEVEAEAAAAAADREDALVDSASDEEPGFLDAIFAPPVGAVTLAPSDTQYPRPASDSGLIDAVPWGDTNGDEPAVPDAFVGEPPIAGLPPISEVPSADSPWSSAPLPSDPTLALSLDEPEPSADPDPDPEPHPGTTADPEPQAEPAADASEPIADSPARLAADAIETQTVNKEQLLAAIAEQAIPTGPTVLAAHCPDGHVSPAYAGICRVCRQPLPSQEPFTTPRPMLGVLKFSTGDIVSLDRGVIMGRAPGAPDTLDPDRPHVVKLASTGDEISRTHLEIRLDGWHVLAVDLGSTNGTVVTPPGQDAVKLREHDPVVIEPGTEVNLADEVTFVFEATA